MPAKILLLHSGNESFIRLDLDLLRQSFHLDDYYARRKFPLEMIRLLRAVNNVDVVYCWFASWNSFWALLISRLLRKGSILVIGGYDLANLPEANYGHQRSGVMKWISRFAMKLATVLFTNSYFSKKEAEQNARVPSKRVRVIYHGVPDPFGELPSFQRERLALTVGNVEWPNLKRKGLEPFVRTAALLPDVQFVLVGVWADDSINFLRSIATANVTFTGRVSDEELLDFYRKASIYVQASLHEGFGMSVAEAMLAGCVPVTTRAGSLPEVVGDCGIYCASPDPLDISNAIEAAIDSPLPIREQARERILNFFSLEKRKNLLEEIIMFVSQKELRS